MRKFYYIIMACAAAIAAHADDGKFRIEAETTEYADGTVVTLELVGNSSTPNTVVDSVVIKGGKFVFEGMCSTDAKWAVIKTKGQFLPLSDFYLEPGVITMKGSKYDLVAHGTPVNEQHFEYNAVINSLNDSLYSTNLSRSMSEDPAEKARLTAELLRLEELQLQRELNFVKKYPNSPISLSIAGTRSTKASSATLKNMLSLLGEKNRQQPKYSQLMDLAEQLSKTEQGAVAPAFTLPSFDGKQVSLSDYSGKYVLIDFWASWCAPCRASFPAVKEVYEAYKDKNFVIVGLSLDNKKDAWEKAVKEENVPWVQIVDLDGKVAKSYAVTAIPAMILVRPDGKIDEKINRTELKEQIGRILNK